MNKPLFSIITICYNSENTIERTIKSVLSQTLTDFEYIIVDGASKDNTLEIANSYKAAFGDRLRISSEPDKGIYDAMNKGIKMAIGDIIGIVNSDDWLETNALQIVYEAYLLNKKSLNTLYCGSMNFCYLDGTIQIMKSNERLFLKSAPKYSVAGVRHPAVFVPKQIYTQLGLFDERIKIQADSDFLLRCFFANVKFFFIDEILTNMQDGGISNNGYLLERCKGRYILLTKHCPNTTKRQFSIIVYTFRLLVKKMMGNKMLKLIRNWKW